MSSYHLSEKTNILKSEIDSKSMIQERCLPYAGQVQIHEGFRFQTDLENVAHDVNVLGAVCDTVVAHTNEELLGGFEQFRVLEPNLELGRCNLTNLATKSNFENPRNSFETTVSCAKLDFRRLAEDGLVAILLGFLHLKYLSRVLEISLFSESSSIFKDEEFNEWIMP